MASAGSLWYSSSLVHHHRSASSSRPLPISPHTRVCVCVSITTGRKVARNVAAMASSEDSPVLIIEEVAPPPPLPSLDTSQSSSDPDIILNTIQDAWDNLEDKYTVLALVVALLIALSASSGLISAIDRLPLIPGVLELVGIGYTGWFAYQNLIFQSNREALFRKIKEIYCEITGSSLV